MRTLLWVIPAVLYLSFAYWYTNTDGPLTDDEIETFIAALTSRNLESERIDAVRAFMASDTGNQFLMLNNLDMAEDPAHVPGAPAGETAEQLLGHYMEHMYPEMLKRASHPVYAGDAVALALDLSGVSDAEQWTRGALVRYRSRRDMMEIATNPLFFERHDFKMAALDKTIAYPLENVLYFSDPRALLALLLIAVVALMDNIILRKRLRDGFA